MHKFRTILSVVATAAMVLGTMGAASAASVTNETRADFIVQLDQSLGIQPVTPSTPDFTDVPASNADYGYIEAAYQKGFINGIAKGLFGPTMPITRAEAAKILVEAYEGGNYTPTQTSTTFTDNASIPSALVGFVAEANSLKLMLGFTSGAFGPEAYLTTAQETHLITQLKAVQAAAGFKVSASATDVAVGQIVTLSSTAVGSVSYTVTGANASSALISGSSFVASAAGNYTVTGTDAAGDTATVTIGVYGAATGLKISAPTSVVANGASQTNVTVSVVDANGNVVADNTDEIQLSTGTTSAFAGSIATSANGPFSGSSYTGTATEPAVNGVATFVLQSGTVPGASLTLTGSDTTPPSGFNTSATYSASVTNTAQVATSLGVSPSTQDLSVNGNTNLGATVGVQVLDQSGEPMLYGTYPFTVNISGPAEFADGTTTAHSYAYTGNAQAGSDAGAQNVIIDGLQGQTGAITVSVTSTNLKSASATITSVISGSVAAIDLSAPSTTSFAEGDTSGLTYTIQFVDANGYPVAAPSGENVLITVDNGGNLASNILVNGQAQSSTDGGYAVPLSQLTATGSVGQYSFALTDNGGAGDAGTYTVQVADNSDTGLTASAADTFTETASTPAAVSVSGATYLSAANPTEAITAQVVDAYGNPVAVSGIPVSFSSTANVANESAPSLSATSVDTNASGVATVTATVPAYVNPGTSAQYSVTATMTYNGTSNIGMPSTIASLTSDTNVQDFSVESTVATSVQVYLQDVQTGSTYNTSSGIATAGDEVQATVYAVDQYGNPVTSSDSITLSYSGTGSVADNGTNGQMLSTSSPSAASSDNVTLTNGKAVQDLWALGSGPVTVTASDNSAPGSVSGTAALTVEPGPISAFGVSAGTSAASNLSVSANTPVTLTIQGNDGYGNVSYLSSASSIVGYAVYLQSSDSTGAFRLSTTGGNVNNVIVPAGSSGVTAYYVDGSTTSVTLTAPDYVSYSNDATNDTLTFNANGTDFAGGGTLTVNGKSVSASPAGTFTWNYGSTSGTATVVYTNGAGNISITFQVNY